MATTQSKVKQGTYTLELPKDGSGPEVWTVSLRDISEETYIAATRLFRKDKDMEAMKFLLQNLEVSGDDIAAVTSDWKAVYASAEQIMGLLPQAQGRLKKN